jgi:hypothetical protein
MTTQVTGTVTVTLADAPGSFVVVQSACACCAAPKAPAAAMTAMVDTRERSLALLRI